MRHASLPLAALVLAAAAPLGSQPAPVQQLPVFGSGVTLVAVPVFVTDKNGKAVPGLTAADFEIEDQGRKVPIVGFEAVDARKAAPGGDATALMQAASRRQFLLLFDLAFSAPTGIMKARAAAIRFVRESLAPTDLVAVATYGQAGVRVLLRFTSDRDQAARAIETLGVGEGERLRDPLNIAYDLGVSPSGPGIGPPPDDRLSEELIATARQISRAEQTQYRQRVDSFLGGLQNLGRMLDSVQGRKQVILLSAGFDSSILGGATGQEAADAAQAVAEGRLWDVQSDRQFGDATARQEIDAVFQALNASDTVIHSVDVTGMVAGAAVDEAQPTHPAQGRDTLAQFAANTGGRFIKDANDLGAGLREVLDATSTYYVLAFEPNDADKKRDRPHKLKVKVLRAGLDVSSRRAYLPPDPKRELDPASQQLQAAEAIAKGLTGGPIRLSAVAVPYRNAKGKVSLPVVLEIDGKTLLAGGATKQLRIEIFGYALGADGHVYDAVALAPTLDVAAGKASIETKGLQVLTAFAVPEGAIDLRFLVRDGASRRAGSLRLQLDVPAFKAGGPVLSPPIAMDDPHSRLVLPAASRALSALEIPFRLQDTPFTAELFPMLVNGAQREVCVIAWGGSARFGTKSEFEVVAHLVDAAGASIELPLAGPARVVPDNDGLQRYVLMLAPKSVPAGEYSLQISFKNAGGESVSSRTAVKVQ
jgi:VWFA-related protein